MSEPLRQGLPLRAILVVVALAIEPGCGEKQGTTEESQRSRESPEMVETKEQSQRSWEWPIMVDTEDESQVSWESPKMLAVKREWESLWDTYLKTPEKISGVKRDTYTEVVRMRGDLLRKRLSDQNVRQLVASCGSLPIHSRDWNNSDKAVIEFMVEVLLYLRDRESLVTLLSTRFPLRMGNWPIEFYLAQQGWLKDAILILGDAYSKCQIPEVRHDIAAAVRRAFGGLRISGKDDSDFVANAMQWYNKEKDHVVVDTRNAPDAYCDEFLPLEPEEGSAGQYERVWGRKHSLFVTKPGVERRENHADQSNEPEPRSLDAVTDRTPPRQAGGRGTENEVAKLIGMWEVLEVIDDGKPVRKEKIKGFRFVFGGGTLRWINPDGEKDEFRVRLGSQQQPCAINLLQTPRSAPKREQTTALVHEFQDKTTSAIYELKGDTLRMCLPRRGAWQRPTSFNAEEGSRETSLTLRRVKE